MLSIFSGSRGFHWLDLPSPFGRKFHFVLQESHTSSVSKVSFDRINKFVEAHSYPFTPLESLNDNITDTNDDSDFVADVDPDTLTRIVHHEL